MRYALPLLLAPRVRPAADPTISPGLRVICNGRTSDGSHHQVMAANRDEAVALAKKEYPDMVAPACSPNPRR
jgi:hypothetical protein